MTATVEPAGPVAQARRRPLVGLLGADAVSIIGNAQTAVAVPWLVLATTGSAARTGLASFAALLPVVISAGLGSAIVDRIGFRRTSIASDAGSALIVAAIPALYATTGLPFWALLVLLFFRWLLATPGRTARDALLPDLATAARWPIERATSASDGMYRAGTMIGAPLAGALIGLLGTAHLLYVDGATFAVSALLVGATVTGVPEPEPEPEAPYLTRLRAGVAFLRGDALLSGLVLVVLIANMLDAGWSEVLLPVYARSVLHSALAFGAIGGAFGAGAVAGTIAFGWRGSRLPRRATFVIAFVICGAPRFAVMATDAHLAAVLTTMACCGLTAGALNPLLGTIMYGRIPARLRARVLGVVTAGSFAGMPLGGLLAGYATQLAGLRPTVLAFGAVYVIAALLALRAPAARWADPGTDR